MRDLLLLAASGLAREVASAQLTEYRVVGILDDDESLHGTSVGGIEVIGGIDLAADREEDLVVCVGSGSVRHLVVDRLRALDVEADRYATVIDASVRVPLTCSVGSGSVLLAGVVLTADVRVGRHVVAMPGVTMTHDDLVGDFVTLAAGVTLGGTVRLGEESYIGMNASVRQNVRVGAGALVGMGAVVLTDVPAGETWVGVPARASIAATGATG